MNSNRKVALVTGSSQRIGAAIVRSLHANGMDVAIHYNNSESKANQLQRELNDLRAGSATTFHADFSDLATVTSFGNGVVNHFGRLDVLINNASIFDLESDAALSMEGYQNLVDIHIGTPYFLTLAVAEALKETNGCVINITDIYAQRPNASLALYSASKAALESMTKSFALEFAPRVRVNAIAPGAILWPNDDTESESILEKTPLGRLGRVEEIANAVNYLVFNATFTTGQVLTIDGGRTVTTP